VITDEIFTKAGQPASTAGTVQSLERERMVAEGERNPKDPSDEGLCGA
jgi:hypothetical protein